MLVLGLGSDGDCFLVEVAGVEASQALQVRALDAPRGRARGAGQGVQNRALDGRGDAPSELDPARTFDGARFQFAPQALALL